MTQPSGRTACPKCGSSNFTNVSACWKCSAALAPSAAGSLPPTQPPPSVPYDVVVSMLPGQQRQASPAQAAPTAPALPHPTVTAGARAYPEPGSIRAAVALGLLLPLVGLPVGLVFMMLADRRLQEVGRVCVVWSVVGSVLHAAATAVTALGMREALGALIGGARGALDRPGLGVPGL